MSDFDDEFYKYISKFNLTEEALNELPVIPKDFPLKIREAIEELFMSIDFKGEAHKGIWGDDELNAINKLTQSKSLTNFYRHIEKFQLKACDIQSLITEVLAGSYSGLIRENYKWRLAEYERFRGTYEQIASTAFKLFELLETGDIPSNSELSDFKNNTSISRDLMGLLSASTSHQWPKLYWKWIADQDKRYFDDGLDPAHNAKVANLHRFNEAAPDFSEVNECKLREMPELFHREYLSTDTKFPPPKPTRKPVTITSKWDHFKFIELALTELNKLSGKLNRRVEPVRKGNYLYPNEFCYLFFSAGHWRSLLEVLFNVDADNKSINEVIKRFKENNYNNN